VAKLTRTHRGSSERARMAPCGVRSAGVRLAHRVHDGENNLPGKGEIRGIVAVTNENVVDLDVTTLPKKTRKFARVDVLGYRSAGGIRMKWKRARFVWRKKSIRLLWGVTPRREEENRAPDGGGGENQL